MKVTLKVRPGEDNPEEWARLLLPFAMASRDLNPPFQIIETYTNACRVSCAEDLLDNLREYFDDYLMVEVEDEDY